MSLSAAFRIVQWHRPRTLAALTLLALVSTGCAGSSNSAPMAYSRDLRQGDALGLYIGHAVNQRTLAMRQQQANPTLPVVASGQEPKGQ
jgi:hypothetical protein